MDFSHGIIAVLHSQAIYNDVNILNFRNCLGLKSRSIKNERTDLFKIANTDASSNESRVNLSLNQKGGEDREGENSKKLTS